MSAADAVYIFVTLVGPALFVCWMAKVLMQ